MRSASAFVRLAQGVLLAGLAPIGAAARQPAAVTIDGPAAPVAPAVMSRDASGRVTMRATQIDQPLRIDGVLDDAPYRSVQSISDFIQQEPDEGQPASEKTEVWILADRDHLYIGVRCHDSQARRIVANDMRRDNTARSAMRAAGRRRWRFRSGRCGTGPAPRRCGGSISAARSAGRTSSCI